MVKVMVKYYEDADFYEYLRELARENHMTFSEFMRMIVRLGLEEAVMRDMIKGVIREVIR